MTVAMDGHIVVDDQGIARIQGSRIKVIHLIMEKLGNGWGPDQLKEQFSHLSLGQIHAALAYYYDHQEDIDRVIDQSLALAKQTASASQPAATREQLLHRLAEQGE